MKFSDRLLQETHVDVLQRIGRRAFRLLGINLHGKLESFEVYLGVGMPNPVRRVVFPSFARKLGIEWNLPRKKIDGGLFVRIEPAMGTDGALKKSHQEPTVLFRPSSFNRQDRE